MKNLINELIDTYEKYDEFKRQLEGYHNFIKSEDGKFAADVLRICQASAVKELLTVRFTKLPASEKDVMQRTIYQLNQVFEFLMAPMTEVNKKKQRVHKLNPVPMGAARPNPTRKEKKNGR